MRATDLFLYKKMNIVLARIYRETENACMKALRKEVNGI